MSAWILIDGALALALPLLAWRAVRAKGLFDACVTFIAYGLLLAVAWVRMGAIDVALAEAAVGAGFTGALLLNALAAMGSAADEPSRKGTPKVDGVRLLACCGAGAGIFACLLSLPETSGAPATHLVGQQLSESGVSNPVTAVLLNFRALDTLLEVGVLWLAVVAALSVAPRQVPHSARVSPFPLLSAGVAILVPCALLAGVYLWWIGSDAPGGAFQGAAMVAGALVSLSLTRACSGMTRDNTRLRALLVAGFVCFLAVAAATALLWGRRLLEYPTGLAYPLILLIEAVCMVSIGAGFGALFAAGRDALGGGGEVA